MLRLLLSFLLLFLSFTIIQAQTDWSPVVTTISHEIIPISKNRVRDINRFSRIARQKHPEISLKNEHIWAIPIYSVYADRKFRRTTIVKYSLLFYFNFKKFYINDIIYLIDSSYYMTADPRYSNIHGQGLWHYQIDAMLSKIIDLDRPDLIFCLAGSNSIFLFVKDNKLYSYYYYCDGIYHVKKITIDEYINSCFDKNEFDLLLMSDRPCPLMYAK
jgi:hypothetical protein